MIRYLLVTAMIILTPPKGNGGTGMGQAGGRHIFRGVKERRSGVQRHFRGFREVADEKGVCR